MDGQRRRAHIAPVVLALALSCCASSLAVACGSTHPSGIAGRAVWRDIFGDTVGLPDAQIVVGEVAAPETRRTVRSGPDGRYRLLLDPGGYSVSVYADFGEGMPTWSGEVRVKDGETTDLPVTLSSNPATLPAPVERRLRETTRALADDLRIARHRAGVSVLGSHAGRTAALFGPLPSLAPERHVYVVVFEGRPTPESPDTAEVRALRRGGYVALLVTAGDLSVCARHVSGSAWRPALGEALGSPGVDGFMPN